MLLAVAFASFFVAASVAGTTVTTAANKAPKKRGRPSGTRKETGRGKKGGANHLKKRSKKSTNVAIANKALWREQQAAAATVAVAAANLASVADVAQNAEQGS